ncbi:MAG: transcription elongation factor GreA [Candidatus Nealsonbacteria bacterium CG09_land_8_20_14_0_10_42_14]|uniref:Transcription elongation factor GreA n=1 Tax=Candidatus Nealsonbacteria bacterium CG09_land_8_20_14_0_10_42_14 TaxID=1974707 RepID=A0A2H0WXN7_9BACT|nr:MAG: transcription elongation factor GreA [Candidatus Nealsonbacteria bacterium CG09_land_8_20_14_0_10_42_14]
MEEKTFYLTKEGLARIKKECDGLKKIKLAKSKGESPKIIHPEEPPSEYLAYQEDLLLLNSKIAELENIFKNAQIIKFPPKIKQNVVDLGATVLVSVDGQDDEFTLVGSLEANPLLGRISNESPVGAALIGHRPGDKIVVSSPARTIYKIKKIKYNKV